MPFLDVSGDNAASTALGAYGSGSTAFGASGSTAFGASKLNEKPDLNSKFLPG